MTESKRFSKCKYMWKVFDWQTSEILNFKGIIQTLNSLSEENEICKTAYLEIKENAIHLKEENEQLKQFQKEVLQAHFNMYRRVYNPIDENIVDELNVIKSIAKDLGVDLE